MIQLENSDRAAKYHLQEIGQFYTLYNVAAFSSNFPFKMTKTLDDLYIADKFE
jgi:hypothetical protein